MIDINKFDDDNLAKIKGYVMKNIKKTPIKDYYLFTTDPLEKSKIFVWCYRILSNVMNLLKGEEPTGIRKNIEENLKTYKDRFLKMQAIVNSLNNTSFNRFRKEKVLGQLSADVEIDHFIDIFAVLAEESSIYDISRDRNFILEGRSGVAYKKVFGDASKEEFKEM